MGIPLDSTPHKLQGHTAGRMKALFMEFQQETHENIPAQMIPTGKPREHSCWRAPAGSWRPYLFPAKEAGQWQRGWVEGLSQPPGPSKDSLTSASCWGWIVSGLKSPFPRSSVFVHSWLPCLPGQCTFPLDPSLCVSSLSWVSLKSMKL